MTEQRNPQESPSEASSKKVEDLTKSSYKTVIYLATATETWQ
ncbi:hypothetical protein [Synechococcus sp. UW179A]|nr:hypothetical protein [Synechococcus sp. UW179A]